MVQDTNDTSHHTPSTVELTAIALSCPTVNNAGGSGGVTVR